MGIIKNLKILGAILVFLVFVLQPIKTGFENGHHGWVSADGLSLMTRADSEHMYVGVMAENLKPEGVYYHYFDRYPPFFTPLMNILLTPFEGDFNAYIMAARYIMNIIFIFTVFFGYKILLYFFEDKRKAFGCALIVFSGHFFIHYKDMPHFDQPAILGNLILIWAISKYKLEQKFKPLIILSVIVPLFGRGYSSIFLLLTWNIIEFLRGEKKIIKHIKSVAFLSLVVSVPLTASFLGYNLYVESKVRNVPITETSIFESASRRLGAKALDSEKEMKAQWHRFIPKQIDRKKDLFSPEVLSMFDIGRKKVSASWEYYLRRLPSEVFGFVVIVLFFMYFRKHYRSLDDNRKVLYLTMCLSGFVWLYTMRKLATYHDYTTLYYVGLALMIYTTLLNTKFSKLSSKFVLNLGVLLFVTSLVANLYKIYPKLTEVNHQADDFNQLVKQAENEIEKPIFYFIPNNPQGGSRFVYGSPFAHNFFTTGHLVTYHEELANVIVHWQDGRIKIKEIKK